MIRWRKEVEVDKGGSSFIRRGQKFASTSLQSQTPPTAVHLHLDSPPSPHPPLSTSTSFLHLFSFSFIAIALVLTARAYGPSDYIQDGLTGAWDAIYNSTNSAGTPVHDANATEWIDLTGLNQPFVLVSGNSSFGEKALVCASRSSGYAATGTQSSYISNYMTIQSAFCGKTDAKPDMCLYNANNWGIQRSIYLKGNDKRIFAVQSGTYPYIATDWRNVALDVAFVYDIANTLACYIRYLNGTLQESTAAANAAWTDSSWYPAIGAKNTSGASPFIGDLYALRHYSRRLSAAEVAYNAHLDQARYNYAGNVHVLGFPEENGSPSPAYGSQTLEEGTEQTFTCGPTRTYEDGVVAADLGTGVRARCLGYRLGDGSSARVASTSATVTVTDGLTLAWDWDVQYLVTVQSTTAAPSVSIAGGTAAAAVSNWVSRGSSVVVKGTPTSGKICGWLGMPSGSALDVKNSEVTLFPVAPITIRPIVATGGVRYWRSTSSADSDVAANWLDLDGNAGCPVTGDSIILDTGSQPLTWTLSGVSPQNWIQSGYTGKVKFRVGTSRAEGGTLAADGENRELNLTGDVMLADGVWASDVNTSYAATSEEVTSMEGRYRLWVTVGGDMSVSASASLDVKDCGFKRSIGAGYHSVGGAHGGMGKWSDYITLGSPFEPTLVGSGGNPDFSGYGAGAIKLSVGGTLALDGLVNASPSEYKSDVSTVLSSHYPAPGGSIWLTAKRMTGSGSVLANCGEATSSGRTAGGGRIAFYLTGTGETFDDLGWQVECNGLNSGTIYRELASDTLHHGELMVTALGAADASRSTTATNYANSTPLKPLDGESVFKFRKLTLKGGVILNVLTGATLDLTDTEISANTLKNDALAVSGGTLQLPGTTYTFDKTKPQLWVAGPHSTIEFKGTGAKTLTLANSARFDYPMSLDCSLTLASGATLFHTAQLVSGIVNYAVDLGLTGDLTVDSGASISANASGFANDGPGKSVASGGGGSYGGRGYGAGSNSKTYGDFRDPEWCGSGTARGGGLVRLDVAGAVSLAGPVTATGGQNSDGSGSGGGINIKCGSISSTATGKIQANAAANNQWQKSGGGGGRIAISVRDDKADFSQLTGVVEAFGGGWNNPGSGQKLGGAGTIYYRLPNEGLSDGTLVIDQGNHTYNDDGADGPTTEFGSDYDGWTVRRLVLKNKAHFRVRKGVTLNVTECWTNDNSGVVDCELGDADTNPGCVAFTDATRTGWIWGLNTFAMFQCRAAGKTLRFGNATSNKLTVVAGGVIDLQGTNDEGTVTTLNLRGITDTTYWPIVLETGVNSTLKNLDVSYSDANDSILKPVAYDTADDKTCRNWGFVNVVVGARITWTGAMSEDWANADNWDLGRRPETTDTVIIPEGTSRSPTLSSTVELNELVVTNGATLALGGCGLTVKKSAKFFGRLVASGSENLFFSGDVDFTGGTFVPARSTVTLNGSGDETFKPAGNSFYRLVLAKTGGALSAVGNLGTTEVVCSDLTAPFTVSFTSGAAWSVERLYLNGVIGDAAALTLSGGPWSLAVSQLQQVKGVAVANCTATKLKIWDQSPYVDNGNNSNWGFETGGKRWTGGVNNYFSEGGNWEGGIAPGAADYVAFTGAVLIVVTNDTVIREADFASGMTLIRAENGASLAVANTLVVEDGAIARLDLPVAATNAVVREGGLIQHTPCTTTDATHYGIDLTVNEKLLVEEGGIIDAVSRGYSAERGPGYCDCGAAHGGAYECGTAQYGEYLCYGSIFEPKLPGSGGNGSHAGVSSDATVKGHGGGVVRLRVGNTFELNGSVAADGWTNQNHYCGSGGSVWITVGRLTGTGLISADGGRYVNTAGGGGGRVAVYRTAEDERDDSAFTGEIRAWGGRSTAQGSMPAASCGTVYLAWRDTPTGAGELVLDNGSATGAAIADEYARGTEFGVSEARYGDPLKSLRKLRIVIRNRAALRLVESATVGDLDVLTENTRIFLRDRKLTIHDWTHHNGKGWSVPNPTTYLTTSVKSGSKGLGRLIWQPRGLAVILK